jgi:hypothetical protein
MITSLTNRLNFEQFHLPVGELFAGPRHTSRSASGANAPPAHNLRIQQPVLQLCDEFQIGPTLKEWELHSQWIADIRESIETFKQLMQ